MLIPTRFRHLFVPAFCAALIASLALPSAAEEPPALIPAEQFAKLPANGKLAFAPDGKHFASLLELKGHQALAVADFPGLTGKSYLAPFDGDVVSFRWVTSDVIELRTGKLGASLLDVYAARSGLAYLSIGKKSFERIPGGGYPLRLVPGSDTDVLVDIGGQYDVVNLVTGDTTRRIRGYLPGFESPTWVLDSSLVIRAGWAWRRSSRKIETWLRDSEQAPWRKVSEFDPEQERGLYPVAFNAEGNLLVLSNLATGYFALHRFDPKTSLPGELLAGLEGVDIDARDLIDARGRIDPIGVTIQADKPQTFWFDEVREKTQRLIDASLPPENVNQLQFINDGNVLVSSHGPGDPGTYYFFDTAAKTLTRWQRAKPWIAPAQMATTRVIRYRARDGLAIRAYLTLPRGRPAQNLPLVVWVHGGPHARDHWGFDSVVQYLANRGYAVLQSNFRGSTGFGEAFVRAGFKQWGQAMQDDLTDGVLSLVSQGTVDAKRVCIGGGSYGGYAALMGTIREPELFRCAIDYLGPTDLVWDVELPYTDYNWYFNKEMDRSLKKITGDPDKPEERKMMEANSPRLHADKIKAPVLLIYGSNDDRVPVVHGTAMKSALEAAGARFEWKLFSGEGHGVRSTENQADLLRTLGGFVERHLGPGAVAAESASVPRP